MAPSKVNKREADYSNIGVAGRKTGITLKDSGIRDEHGLEPIDGLFSSPEKSPVKQNGSGHQSTITEEEDMDIGHSTIPEPTEVLTANRTRTGKPLLPPPHARSPIKTSLGSSPRRSLGPMSSPRRNGDTPSRAMSHPLVNRRLDFSMEEPRQSVERSPKNTHSVVTASSSVVRKGKLLQTSGRGRKRPFSLSLEDDEKEEDIGNISDTGLPVFASQADVFDVPADGDDSFPVNGDHGLEVPEDSQEEISEVVEQPKANIGAKKRGRKPKVAVVDDSPVLAKAATPVDPPIMKKRGRPPKQQIIGIDESQLVPIEEGEEIPSIAENEDVPQKNKRGPKKSNLDVHRDEEQQELEAGSSKPAKRARHDSVGASPAKAIRKGPKPPPSERDPNARVTTAKGKGKASSMEPTSSAAFGKPKPRSLYLLRHETPAEDDGSRLLRSGRTSVKPIAYWRGERIVYGDTSLEGKNVVLPAIKEVIRTEEIVHQRPKKSYYRRGAGKPQKLRILDDADEEDEDQEEWELAPGVLRAEVVQWDPVTQRGVEDNIEDVELALAPAALQAMTREVKGAEFTYAKMLTLPFFHSGMVDLPPGGVKRMKNSRKNHMVFWVFYGRVRVNVAGTEFSIGRGGMWQVPRGNFYSIANHYEKPARVFFAQGCYMEAMEVSLVEAEEGEEGEGSGSRS